MRRSRVSLIVPVFNGFDLARCMISHLQTNMTEPDTEIVALDNGSTDGEFVPPPHPATRVVRLPSNVGVYGVLALAPAIASKESEIIAVLHSDLFVHERGFDARLRSAFSSRSSLGLLGFVGSNEIDPAGGRGSGTASNLIGAEVQCNGCRWTGTPAEVHGRRLRGFERAAVVDGCAMIFRRDALEALPPRHDFPPHHFYDRLASCEIRERGWEIGVLGIACDHISTQTANSSSGYYDLAREWCRARLGIQESVNWDMELYRAAERAWLSEYRDSKRLVPCTVDRRWPSNSLRGPRVNLGCDTYHFPQFINIDLRRDGSIVPEVLADVCKLPFADGSCAFLYAGHLLEHIYHDLAPEVLAEWRRVLVDGGKLVIVVPDVGTSMKRYARGEYSLDQIIPQIFGNYRSPDPEPQRHRYAYDRGKLLETVKRVPWESVDWLEYSDPPPEIRDFVGRQIVLADWQMGVVLVK